MIVFHSPDDDAEDARDAEEALAEGGAIPADRLWAELGLAEDVEAAAVRQSVREGAPTTPHEEIVRRYS